MACRVKLEDRLAAVASARESADSAAAARDVDCERQLDQLDSALQVCQFCAIRIYASLCGGSDCIVEM